MIINTVFDAKAALYYHFVRKPSFKMDEDFPKMEIISVDKEKDKAIIQTALDQYVKCEAAALCKDWYVLNKAFNNQSVELSPNVTSELSKVLNDACDISGTEDCRCDPNGITERDVGNLISLCKMLFVKIHADNQEKE